MPEPSVGAHDFRPYHLVMMPLAFLFFRGLGAFSRLLSFGTWANKGWYPFWILDFGFWIFNFG
jgi:hypothetical protein